MCHIIKAVHIRNLLKMREPSGHHVGPYGVITQRRTADNIRLQLDVDSHRRDIARSYNE